VSIAASAIASGRAYARHKPEDTLLYQAVATYFDDFVAFARERHGHALPKYVRQAFERYLACGRLDHGFARVQCAHCRHEFAVAFSCKDRGLCPSCGQRRMVDLAAQLVDRVFPRDVPVRQWVLSVPWELRILVARDPKVLSHLLRVFHDEVEKSYLARVRTELPGKRRAAAVSFIQRFSGSLGVNVHDHSVWLDGVYVLPPGDAPPTFVAAIPPTHAEIEHVATRVCERMFRWLRRTKRIEHRDAADRSNEAPEPDALTSLLFAGSQRGTLAPVTDPLARAAGTGASRAEHDSHLEAHARQRKSRWAGNVEGFSVHAGTAVAAGNHFGLEQLLRYCARPSVSLERLSRLPDGRFAYRVKHPIGNKTHRVMEPMEFMARLASMVAPPRYPLVRYFGVFAPGSRDRKRVVPGRAAKRTRCCAAHETAKRASTAAANEAMPARDEAPERASAIALAAPISPALDGGTRIPWADLLRHGFDLDALRCPRCAGTMRVLAVVQDRDECLRYMEHAGIPTRRDVPQRAWDPVPIDPAPQDDWVA
jgi:hypothetical protein